jgi:hypothetical protein
LTPFVVAPMSVADVDVEDAFVLVVFTDGDVHLGCWAATGSTVWTVFLVAGGVGEWTQLAAITSLAQLGEVLPGLVPPPTGAPAWAPGLAVTLGAEYTYGGSTWKVITAHTTQVGWEPPNVPALWVKV